MPQDSNAALPVDGHIGARINRASKSKLSNQSRIQVKIIAVVGGAGCDDRLNGDELDDDGDGKYTNFLRRPGCYHNCRSSMAKSKSFGCNCAFMKRSIASFSLRFLQPAGPFF
jgi:hypothetical protein